MKKIYDAFCSFEVLLTNINLIIMTGLIFISAIARTVGHPVNWASDVSLLMFAWQVFLGGDIAVRNHLLVGVDMLVTHFPNKVQKALSIAFSIIIIAFLIVLVYYGIPLVLDSKKRLFNTLQLSYGWCTLAVPVGAVLMVISTFINLYRDIKKPSTEWGK